MANIDIGNQNDFVDRRHGRGGNHPAAEFANLKDIAAMKARLTALSASRYPAAKLETMTENDMIYAIRVESADVAGI